MGKGKNGKPDCCNRIDFGDAVCAGIGGHGRAFRFYNGRVAKLEMCIRDRAQAVMKLFHDAGVRALEVYKDFNGLDRVVIGTVENGVSSSG